MKLCGPQRHFELRILRGPDLEDWCRVRIDVDTPQGRWSATACCLEGREVRWLADWLEETLSDAEEPWEFLEPELRFRFPARDRTTRRVYFAYRFCPRWLPPDSAEDFHVDFPVTGKALHQAAQALREQLPPDYKKRK